MLGESFLDRGQGSMGNQKEVETLCCDRDQNTQSVSWRVLTQDEGTQFTDGLAIESGDW